MIPQRALGSDTAPSHNLVERLIRARRSSGVRTVLVHVVGGTPQGWAALTRGPAVRRHGLSRGGLPRRCPPGCGCRAVPDRRRDGTDLWVPETPHISRDLLIFVEQSAEAVAPSETFRVARSRLGSGRRERPGPAPEARRARR